MWTHTYNTSTQEQEDFYKCKASLSYIDLVSKINA